MKLINSIIFTPSVFVTADKFENAKIEVQKAKLLGSPLGAGDFVGISVSILAVLSVIECQAGLYRFSAGSRLV